MSTGGDNFDPFNSKTIEAPSKPKRNTKFIAIAAVAAIAVGILAVLGYQGSLYNSAGTVAPNSDNNVYVNRGYNFQMQYPAGWKVNQGATVQDLKGNLAALDGSSFIVVFQGPFVNNYGVNINVVTENMQGYSLREYVQQAKSGLAQTLSMNNYRLVGEQQSEYGGHDAYIIRYLALLDGTQTTVASIIVQDGANALVMSYAAPSSAYDTYLPQALQSVESLEFLN